MTSIRDLYFGSERYADYNQITEFLIVGDDSYLLEPRVAAELADRGVTHILDCRREANYWKPEEVPAGFVYFRNGCQDDGQPKSVGYYRRSLVFALRALHDNEDAVLYVHCAAGINRGPSNALAILVALGWSKDEAFALIKERRPAAWIQYKDCAAEAVEALRKEIPQWL